MSARCHARVDGEQCRIYEGHGDFGVPHRFTGEPQGLIEGLDAKAADRERWDRAVMGVEMVSTLRKMGFAHGISVAAGVVCSLAKEAGFDRVRFLAFLGTIFDQTSTHDEMRRADAAPADDAADDADLAAIRARAEAATPGPWQTWRKGNAHTVDANGNRRGYGRSLLVGPVVPFNENGLWQPGPEELPMCNEDADFIAHARTDIPRLLALIDRLRAGRAAAGLPAQAERDPVRSGMAR